MKSRIYWVSEAARTALGWALPSSRVLRLSAYFSCVSAIGLLVAARALYAASREDAFELGHELLGLADFTRGAETVLVNGERFHHAVSATADPLHTVLDRVEAHCRHNPGSAALVLERLAESDQKRFERHAPPGALRNAVFREEAATRGMVLCFVGGPTGASVASWLLALQRFSTTRDLASFGRLRYVFAESERTAERESTRVVSLWADTGLNLSRLFPRAGDAPGSDSTAVPRPPTARRVLSASAEGLPFSVRSYESSQSLVATQSFYDSWMAAHGYQAAHASEFGASSYLRDDGYQAFVSLLSSDHHTIVTVTESGQSDTSAALELDVDP
jgi:hypothetical protein